MDQPRITQQTTSTTLPLRGEVIHDAPWPKTLAGRSFVAPLQWALEGQGWGVVRPVVDLIVLYLAVIVALLRMRVTDMYPQERSTRSAGWNSSRKPKSSCWTRRP